MKITDIQCNQFLQNPNVPQDLKKELANKAIEERWSFVGT